MVWRWGGQALIRWGKGQGREGAPASRGEKDRKGWGKAEGSIFQPPRANKPEQETGKGLPSNSYTAMVGAAVLVFT